MTTAEILLHLPGKAGKFFGELALSPLYPQGFLAGPKKLGAGLVCLTGGGHAIRAEVKIVRREGPLEAQARFGVRPYGSAVARRSGPGLPGVTTRHLEYDTSRQEGCGGGPISRERCPRG